MTFSDYIDYLRGKRIGVIGFREQSAARACAAAKRL